MYVLTLFLSYRLGLHSKYFNETDVYKYKVGVNLTPIYRHGNYCNNYGDQEYHIGLVIFISLESQDFYLKTIVQRFFCCHKNWI